MVENTMIEILLRKKIANETDVYRFCPTMVKELQKLLEKDLPEATRARVEKTLRIVKEGLQGIGVR
jgi:hypothetical protein